MNGEGKYGDPLSAREYQVLAVYARLGDQRHVASALAISMQTVKNHLSNAYRKLGVETNFQAFRVMGWLTAPGDDVLSVEMTAATRLRWLEGAILKLADQMRTPGSSGGSGARSTGAVTSASSPS